MSWTPSLGAQYRGYGTEFRVWAPESETLEVVLERPGEPPSFTRMERTMEGFHAAVVQGASPGELYRFRLNGDQIFPDPASRFQPQGVHGPSQIVDPSAFPWTDTAWRNVPIEDLVLYELHLGTFTPEGTFASAAAKLPYLRDLGITAVELMPVAAFPGSRNWGYDNAALFAPAACYGTPDDMRRFVDRAHQLGLAVHLDIVFNHVGPDGAYVAAFSPYFFSQLHQSPWGAGINFDGPHSEPVRDFYVECAVRWVDEYHLDGLRLDATHAIVDDSPRHILSSIAATVHSHLAEKGRSALLIAEDHSNLASMALPESKGGMGLDGLWADDFHHQVRRCVHGDSDGYFADFTGSTQDIAATLRQGWFYCGQVAHYFGGPRGSDPTPLAYPQFVICIQNHDQVGNRAFGERLNHQIDLAQWRAASALLLLAPETPLLFMGQEWAAGSPFLFFTDHNPELGRLVTEGRRREFSRFDAFADEKSRQRIPDPQALDTFLKSRLDWSEPPREPHSHILAFYRTLLQLRRTHPALRNRTRDSVSVLALDADTVALSRRAPDRALLAVVRLRGSGESDTGSQFGSDHRWSLVLSSEESRFAADPRPPHIDRSIIRFERPGMILLESSMPERSL